MWIRGRLVMLFMLWAAGPYLVYYGVTHLPAGWPLIPMGLAWLYVGIKISSWLYNYPRRW